MSAILIAMADEAEALLYKAKCLANVGEDNDLALTCFNAAIALSPNIVSAYLGRGRLYAEMKEPALAVADFSKAIEFDPLQAQAYRYRAHALFRLGEFERSIADFSKAIEFHQSAATRVPEFVEASLLGGRAHAYARLGNLDLAMADLNHVIGKFPRVHGFYVARAELFERLGQTQEAQADFAHAESLRSVGGARGWTTYAIRS